MIVVACARIVRTQANINQIAAGWILLTFLYRRIAEELQTFESNIVVTFTSPSERVTAAIKQETPPPPKETLSVVAMCVCNQIAIYRRNVSTCGNDKVIRKTKSRHTV